MNTYYAIADLHGRYDLLEKALEKIDDHSSGFDNYQIITLGDYIDRGKQSRQVIQRLMEEQEKRSNFISIKGNHEDMMIQTITKPLDTDWWFGNGGYATMESYDGQRSNDYAPAYYYHYDLSKVSKDHINWIKELPVYYETPNHVFVHAGVPDPQAPLEEQSTEEMMWMLYGKHEHGWWQGKHVVHGHHQFADGPHQWMGRTDLDTHAYASGRLVIGVFDDDQGPAKEFIEITE